MILQRIEVKINKKSFNRFYKGNQNKETIYSWEKLFKKDQPYVFDFVIDVDSQKIKFSNGLLEISRINDETRI